MPARSLHGALVTAGAIVSLLIPCSIPAHAQPQDTPPSRVETPQSVRNVHEVLHSALIEATKAPGRVGTSAKTLADLLEPHWLREEQMALPPLGLLAPLAAGTRISEADVVTARSMSDTLRREMSSMLAEHKRNREAIDAFRAAAVAERSVKFQQLADELVQHAKEEEDVLYPAAVLVGDLLRARQPGK